MLEEKVDLPTVQQPKGRIKVEITDADTGEVLQKAENDNFISKGMQHLYDIQMKNLFLNNMININNPLRFMVLTDADHDADPENEWLVKGRVIGEAYTDTNTLLGGITGGQLNDVESFTNRNQRRIVVDFPASSANGTISSVYFHPDTHIYDVSVSNIDDIAIAKLDYGNNSFIRKYNGRIYSVDARSGSRDSNTLYVLDLDYNLLSERDLIENRSSAWSYRYIHGMTIYNDRMYFVSANNTTSDPNRRIWSISLATMENSDADDISIFRHSGYGETEEHFEGSGSTSGLTYNPDQQVFYVVDAGAIVVLDTSFNILQRIAIERLPSSGDLIYHDGELYLSAGSIDLDKGVWTKGGATNVYRGFTDDGYVIGDPHRSSIGRKYVHHKFGFTSRAKLSTPVTKTTSNNMKVTYDFILPNMFPEENDF